MNKTTILAALCATAVQANTAQSGFFLDSALGFSHDNSKMVFEDKSDKPDASRPAADDREEPKKMKDGSSSTIILKDGSQLTLKNKSKGSLALRIGAGYRRVFSPQCANSFMASFAVDHTFIFGTKKVDWILKKNPFQKYEGRFGDKTFGRTALVVSPGYRMCAFAIYADLGLSLNYVKYGPEKSNEEENSIIPSKSKVMPAFLVGLGMSYQIAPKIELYANGRVHFLKKWKIKDKIDDGVHLVKKGTAFEIMVGMKFSV